ncbi:MAG: hypothetical protein AB7Q97_18750 [Gammaproteobacteria bacterium]
MRTLLARFALMLLPWFAAGTQAADQYQIAPLVDPSGMGADKALILDSGSGHLWLWVERPADGVNGGARYLIYQGQLRPGKAMGEIIDQQEWPAARKK